MRFLALVTAVSVTAALGAAPVMATPAEDFAKARRTFKRGEYKSAIPLLKDLLYPSARLSAKSELAEAHLLLGVSHFETGREQEAEVEFQTALRYDSELSLDPILFSRKVVAFFAKTKAAYLENAEEDAEMRRLAEERDALANALKNLVVIEKRPYYVNFVPFGAGQFQNGDNRKGLFFSISEAATCGASGVIFSYLMLKYGLGGQVPPEEASSVRRWQQIEIGTGGACLGLMAWGIVDSLMNYKATYRTTPDPSLLPPELRPAPKNRPKRSSDKKKSSSLHLLPTVLPTGAGLVISWEF